MRHLFRLRRVAVAAAEVTVIGGSRGMVSGAASLMAAPVIS
ncbi:hypothetical protein Salmuc_03101 [Salipiger mucosus DSM 16094]|uniref:Uncharacterized protein n=1 Tax=Salipiger mucosus DSM 16094 TaxID=1123237 RepID=S9RP73_9RHOB|nr:hypothetical protein Salmuc_03101 [Salipiger mucosus DSM 16094]